MAAFFNRLDQVKFRPECLCYIWSGAIVSLDIILCDYLILGYACAPNVNTPEKNHSTWKKTVNRITHYYCGIADSKLLGLITMGNLAINISLLIYRCSNEKRNIFDKINLAQYLCTTVIVAKSVGPRLKELRNKDDFILDRDESQDSHITTIDTILKLIAKGHLLRAIGLSASFFLTIYSANHSHSM